MPKQCGGPVARNKSLAFGLLHLSCLLHQCKIGKVKTINTNADLVVDLHVSLTVTSKEEACIGTETYISFKLCLNCI